MMRCYSKRNHGTIPMFLNTPLLHIYIEYMSHYDGRDYGVALWLAPIAEIWKAANQAPMPISLIYMNEIRSNTIKLPVLNLCDYASAHCAREMAHCVICHISACIMELEKPQQMV